MFSNKILFLLLLQCLILSCGKPKTKTCADLLEEYGNTLSTIGVAKQGKIDNNFFLDCTSGVENSIVNDNSKLISFYNPYPNGALFKAEFTSIEKTNQKPEKNKTISENGFRFSYALIHNNTYFMFATNMNKGVFLYKSEDQGDSWKIINNGKPVLTKSDDTKSIFYNIWNVGVDIDNNGTWHMLVECQKDAYSQSEVGLAYTTANLEQDDTINFDKNRVEKIAIKNGGNPFVKVINGKVFAIHGMANESTDFTNLFWYVTASILQVDNEWKTYRNAFSIYKSNIHVADPHAVEVNGKIILTVSYNQVYTIGIKFEKSFEELLNEIELYIPKLDTSVEPVTRRNDI